MTGSIINLAGWLRPLVYPLGLQNWTIASRRVLKHETAQSEDWQQIAPPPFASEESLRSSTDLFRPRF